MNLHTLYLTKNACYQYNRKITPCGVMVHSTGANNPWLKRYVGPDDGLLGKNQYGNHWNTATPGGRKVCPHAFIGKLANGTIATYQVLPWNIEGWHAGGSANSKGYIGFEICEDSLQDPLYFAQVYREAVELTAYLCKKYGITVTNKTVICHKEGNRLGIASSHVDVEHWFPKQGKTMDNFRDDVKATMKGTTPAAPPKKEEPDMTEADVRKIVNSILDEREKALISDKTVPTWAAEEYKEAIAAGITDGSRPNVPLTRMEGAIMAKRAKNP